MTRDPFTSPAKPFPPLTPRRSRRRAWPRALLPHRPSRVDPVGRQAQALDQVGCHHDLGSASGASRVGGVGDGQEGRPGGSRGGEWGGSTLRSLPSSTDRTRLDLESAGIVMSRSDQRFLIHASRSTLLDQSFSIHASRSKLLDQRFSLRGLIRGSCIMSPR
jgi:hypothetical protein